MARIRTIALLAAGAAAVGAVRHRRRAHGAHGGGDGTGDILIRGAGFYDAMSRVLLGRLFQRVAADVAALAPSAGGAGSAGARVLEVGCGPGHLAALLAREHGLDVVGVDLDPAMVQRASVRAARAGRQGDGPHRPSPVFQVADVAALPYPDGRFDLVVSTFSLHHWGDPATGIREVARVLRPGGRALIWDFQPGRCPWERIGHAHQPDVAALAQASPLRLVDATPWRWPGPLRLSQRFELLRAGHAAQGPGPHAAEGAPA